MNKCKRKKLTILESFVISLERKQKFASTIKELKYAFTLSNYYTISYICIHTHIYIYRYYIIDFKYHISLNCSKMFKTLVFFFFLLKIALCSF